MIAKAALLLACAGVAHGHASVIMPPTRNAIDGYMPGTPWSGGRHPPTGWIMPYEGTCTNGTSACNSGQSMFWFNNGCTIGCEACDGNGARVPNRDACPGRPKPAAELMIAPEYRTTNQHSAFGSEQDFWRFNPWRAPGQAPVYDACGMAGGAPTAGFNAAEYNTTRYAKQGDLGSKVLPRRPTGTVWRRGATARARWQQSANHGGGYRYRLCPADAELTEACFQQTPLDFAGDTLTIRYPDPSKDKVINATVVAAGGGKGWMRWPHPNYNKGQCDYAVPRGQHCGDHCPGCVSPYYLADDACPCSCPDQYPGLPQGNTDPATFPDQTGGDPNRDFVVEDTLRVPANITPGDYVLGWRWDCEMTSQIWLSCSDITII